MPTKQEIIGSIMKIIDSDDDERNQQNIESLQDDNEEALQELLDELISEQNE